MEKNEYEMVPIDDHESFIVQPGRKRSSRSRFYRIRSNLLSRSVVSATFKVLAVAFIVLQCLASYKIENQLAKENSEMSNSTYLILEELAYVKTLLDRQCIETTVNGQITENEVNTIRFLL